MTIYPPLQSTHTIVRHVGHRKVHTLNPYFSHEIRQLTTVADGSARLMNGSVFKHETSRLEIGTGEGRHVLLSSTPEINHAFGFLGRVPFRGRFRGLDGDTEIDRMFTPGIVERVFSRNDADPAGVERLELAVVEAAGIAAKAVQVTGAYMVVQGFRQPLEPISNWRNMTMPKAWLTPGEVHSTCAAIKGRLESLEIDAKHGQDRGRPDFGPTAGGG